MVSPSYEDRICAMFDSFSKTTSRNDYRICCALKNAETAITMRNQ